MASLFAFRRRHHICGPLPRLLPIDLSAVAYPEDQNRLVSVAQVADNPIVTDSVPPHGDISFRDLHSCALPARSGPGILKRFQNPLMGLARELFEFLEGGWAELSGPVQVAASRP